jgi:hypothetical protein
VEEKALRREPNLACTQIQQRGRLLVDRIHAAILAHQAREGYWNEQGGAIDGAEAVVEA